MKATDFDAAEYIKTPEDVAYYLEAALEEDDPQFFLKALGTVARSKGMSEIARQTGRGRESLYTALSDLGNPGFVTIYDVLKALGLSLKIEPSHRDPVLV